MIKYKLKKSRLKKQTKYSYKILLIQVPDVKPLQFNAGFFLFTIITMAGIWIGTIIATYVFFGIVLLAGFIALVESNKYLRFLIDRGNKFIDILFFGASLYATASLGITITAALTIAGLGYSLVYAPWLRNGNKQNKK